MRAIVATRYGTPDVLQMKMVPKPTPADHEVLINIKAACVNYNVLATVRGKPLLVRLWSGLLKPTHKIPGGDIAGRVEATGKKVKLFQPGDAVFGDISERGWGGFAEYVCAEEDALALKPAKLSFEAAAAVPQAALVALQGLRDQGRIQPGQRVLIVGASGGIGTFAVQIAKSLGAEVTGVCSTRNLDMVRALGADRAIDYTREDFTENGEGYDLILAIAGYRSIFDFRRALSPGGTYVMVGGTMGQIFEAMLVGPLISLTGPQTLGHLMHQPSQDDLNHMKSLLESGEVKPVIDRCYPLSAVSEALRYYETGHARGKIVLTI